MSAALRSTPHPLVLYSWQHFPTTIHPSNKYSAPIRFIIITIMVLPGIPVVRGYDCVRVSSSLSRGSLVLAVVHSFHPPTNIYRSDYYDSSLK